MSSILMTVFNKYVLSSQAFRMNFFLLLLQSLTSIIMLHFLRRTGLLSYKPFDVATAQQWLPISIMLVAMIYTASKALQYLSVAMFTVFKNLTIILVALMERRFFKLRLTLLKWASFLLIVTSSVKLLY
jgi:GDP-mannose transporter